MPKVTRTLWDRNSRTEGQHSLLWTNGKSTQYIATTFKRIKLKF